MNACQFHLAATALLTLCACSATVASMECNAIEVAATTPEKHLYAVDDPARIDRLRMAADAGRDDVALRTLIALAERGNSLAQRAAGGTLIARGDAQSDVEGRRWLALAAAQGDALAMLSLGRAWLVGTRATPRDAALARQWLIQAHAQSLTRAQAAYYLGLLSLPQDAPQAVAYFRESAEGGVAEAMYQLGNAHASGEGTESDRREAMRWYLRAAALDHPAAIQELSQAFARGDGYLPQSDFQAAQMRLALEHALRHPKAMP